MLTLVRSIVSVLVRRFRPRYIGLLIEGAAQHGLPPAYLDYLRTFDLAADERLSLPQRFRCTITAAVARLYG